VVVVTVTTAAAAIVGNSYSKLHFTRSGSL